MKEESKKELLEMFDKFYLKVDFRIEHLKTVAKEAGYNLDLSVESLNELEEMILKMNVDENHALFDNIASYIGQVVVENYGGKWECCLDKNNSLYYGFPVIAGFNNYDVLLSPYSVLKIFIHRKKSGQIFHSIDICINPPAFDF